MLSCLWRPFLSKAKKIEEELSHHYHPARYCHVRVGDALGRRYHVLGKLGWGQFSTVWNQQWVSIKVLITASLKDPSYERGIMAVLEDGDPDHVGHSRVMHLLDSFVLEGTNGPHTYLVYKVMGESLSFFQPRFLGMKFPWPIMKRISRQLLEALDYIHTCGIIHTELDDSVIESYLKITPGTEDMARLGPNTPVSSTTMTAPRNYMHVNIRLSDFGQAVYSSNHNASMKVQHKDMRAPEVILGLSWGPKIEI